MLLALSLTFSSFVKAKPVKVTPSNYERLVQINNELKKNIEDLTQQLNTSTAQLIEVRNKLNKYEVELKNQSIQLSEASTETDTYKNKLAETLESLKIANEKLIEEEKKYQKEIKDLLWQRNAAATLVLILLLK